MSPSYQPDELTHAELPARDLLVALGWTYVSREDLAEERSNEREVMLKDRLIAALMRLNEWMTVEQAQRVIFNLEHVDEIGMLRNQRIHEYLSYGMPLNITLNGKPDTPTVRFFDFDHPQPGVGLNEYVVTTQYRVRRANERSSTEDDQKVIKPDLVLFVNGIPLVVIEAKSPSLLEVWKTKAVQQLRRYQEAEPRWHGAGAPELFDTNLMCIACSGSDAAFATLHAPENAYVGWKSIRPFSESEFEHRFGVPPEGQARLIAGLLHPPTLLDILRDFVVYEHEQGKLIKKLPRYQQYRAVKQAMERILDGSKPQERGGVVWHTQGSGKSLTMLWLATKLRRSLELQNPTIVVVTDRKQLDKQISDTFKRASGIEPDQATSRAHLRQLLSTNAGRTIMTTIQKFEDEMTEARDGSPVNDAANLYVMIDEAHRTQYGVIAAGMRKALPNATFIGFTGTPIDKGFKRSTMATFGDLIDSYTIPQSVADGATVEIRYEARLPELHIEGSETLDELFDAMFGDQPEETRAEIRRRYANRETVAEADRRIEMVALDISKHFKDRIKPNGFKAQVVAPSRAVALRYAEHLKKFNLSAYPIITIQHNDGPEFNVAKDLNEDQVVEDFKDSEGEPEVLVVVDKLITGFDAPVEQVLYLDKSIREHTLLQAIARVNRRCSLTKDGITTEKTHGLVVDYCGVSRELESALSSFESSDVQGALTELERDPGPSLDAAADRAESHFPGLDLDKTWDCVHRFDADAHTEGEFKADAYQRFDSDYRDFARLMDQYLPEPSALAYLERLKRLTLIRAFARATFLRQDTNVDWEAVGAKVKQLLDTRVAADVRELMTPVSILDADFEQKIEGLPHDEARASVMEHALRAQINERVGENPAFYERLSEALERIIRQLHDQVIDAAEFCKQIATLLDNAKQEESRAAQHGLAPVAFAVYLLLAAAAEGSRTAEAEQGETAVAEDAPSFVGELDERLKDAAERVEVVLQTHQSVIDWRENSDVLREMRRDIKRLLRRDRRFEENELDELASQIIDVSRQRAS
ncbi:MAG: HsdR family type I site-specific deoxyribonuclease [Chloroflexota bacterium]|nr:HsdR family type I site-specific deoxyribonuclease [Chloroflexota bacterium]